MSIFDDWGADLAAELDHARAAYAVAVASVAAATEEARASRLELRAIADAFDRLDRHTTLSASLADRRRRHEDALNSAAGRAALASGVAENARRRVADLELALDQIAALASTDAGTEEASAHELVTTL